MVELPEQWRPFIVPASELLNKVPGVRWDRCVAFDSQLRVYGWVDRPDDERADFVLVDMQLVQGVEPDEMAATTHVITSSPTLSLAINDALDLDPDGHVDCLRVEVVFGGMVDNAIKLNPADDGVQITDTDTRSGWGPRRSDYTQEQYEADRQSREGVDAD